MFSHAKKSRNFQRGGDNLSEAPVVFSLKRPQKDWKELCNFPRAPHPLQAPEENRNRLRAQPLSLRCNRSREGSYGAS